MRPMDLAEESLPSPRFLLFRILIFDLRFLLPPLLVIPAQLLAYSTSHAAQFYYGVEVFISVLFLWLRNFTVTKPSIWWDLFLVCLLSFGSYFMAKVKLPNPASLETLRCLRQESRLQSRSSSPHKVSKKVTLRGEIVGEVITVPNRPVDGAIRFEVLGTVKGALIGDSSVLGRFLLSAPDLPWEEISLVQQGDSIAATVKITFQIPSPEGTPALSSYEGFLFRKGILAAGSIEKASITSSRKRLASKRDAFLLRALATFGYCDALCVILAVLLGEASLLSEPIIEVFRQTGTTHLLVISGAHISMVFGGIFAVVRLILYRCEKVLLYVPLQILGTSVAFLGANFYAFFVGVDITVSRSLVVLFVFVCGEMFGRKSSPFRSLFLAFVMVMLLWPGGFLEPGCQLTFMALLGLLVSRCWVNRRKTHYHELDVVVPVSRWRSFQQRYLFKPLAYSTGAWLFTAPVLLVWFSTFVPLSPVINLFAIPVFGFICMGIGGVALAAWYLALPCSTYSMNAALYLVDVILQALGLCNHVFSSVGLGARSFDPETVWQLAIILGVVLAGVCGLTYVMVVRQKISACSDALQKVCEG